MSGPNLSEYFRNDAPSMFDEIVPSGSTPASNNNIPTTVTGKFHSIFTQMEKRMHLVFQ